MVLTSQDRLGKAHNKNYESMKGIPNQSPFFLKHIWTYQIFLCILIVCSELKNIIVLITSYFYGLHLSLNDYEIFSILQLSNKYVQFSRYIL